MRFHPGIVENKHCTYGAAIYDEFENNTVFACIVFKRRETEYFDGQGYSGYVQWRSPSDE